MTWRLPPACGIWTAIVPPLAFCAAATASLAVPPPWWDDPNPGNAVVVYQKGSAQRARTEAEARAQANEDGLRQLRRRVVEDSRLWPHVGLKGTSVAFESVQRTRGGGWEAWVLVRCARDELEEARAYVAGGRRDFEAAAALHREARFEEALAKAREIVAAYPMGRQPFFDTENALLLAADCLVGLGQASAAVAACREVAERSPSQAFRNTARSKSKTIEERRAEIVLARLFANRDWLVRGEIEIAGEAREWSQAGRSLEAMITRCGGRAGAASAGSEAGAARFPVPPEVCRAWLDGTPAHGLAVFTAKGRLERRARPGAASEEDVQFSGTAHLTLCDKSGFSGSWSRTGLTGWNPLGEEMCVGVLALRALEAFEEELVRQIDK